MRIIMSLFLVLCGVVIPFHGECWAIGDIGIVVEQISQDDKGRVDQCKYCGKIITPGNIHGDAAAVVMGQLKGALSDRIIGYVEGKEKSPYINVYIYRYEERQGGNFAVDKPARIGFHMHLMSKDVVGKVFVYEEDQQALFDNLYTIGRFMKRGGKWVTVDRLSEDGIKKSLDYLLKGIE
jgi:hypothetical protein